MKVLLIFPRRKKKFIDFGLCFVYMYLRITLLLHIIYQVISLTLITPAGTFAIPRTGKNSGARNGSTNVEKCTSQFNR